jgi:hypothetical protein
MTTFSTLNDYTIASLIGRARSRVVFVAPGVENETASALISALDNEKLSVTIILDSDESAYRIGYGDADALKKLHAALSSRQLAVRRQEGLRLGVLVIDDQIAIWSPIARSVEAERTGDQPNAVILTGAPSEQMCNAVGAEASQTLPSDAEIGREALRVEDIAVTVENLKQNPPAPFDLARKTHVFSSRFQFVDSEVRGLEWSERRLKVKSLLLNVDLAEDLRDLLDTYVRPFPANSEDKFDVPALLAGKPAYDKQGKRLTVKASQADVSKIWIEIQKDFLRYLPGFGWLIRRDRVGEFKACCEAFEEVLKTWVEAFLKHSEARADQLVESIVTAILGRAQTLPKEQRPTKETLTQEIRKGLDHLKRTDPKVRIVLKNVAWESTRDDEFTNALKKTIPAEELRGWFEEFVAAPEQRRGGF